MTRILTSWLRAYPSVFLLVVLALHAVWWTALPWMLAPNYPLDVIESLVWSREWQWGYVKHPPLLPWVLGAAMALTGEASWTPYALSQGCIVLALLGVWKLARVYLQPLPAALAVLLLEGCYYYNVTTPELNHNVILLPLWAWFAWALHAAVTHGAAWRWMLVGALAAFAMLAKYFSGFLVLAAGVTLLVTPEGRRCLRTWHPWLGALVGALILVPHGIWLLQYDFLPFSYAMQRAAQAAAVTGVTDWTAHLRSPLAFLLAQTGALAACLLLWGWAFGPLRRRRKSAPPAGFGALWHFHLVYPWLMGLLPVLLVLLYGGWTGGRLRSMWGAPLWNQAGLLLMLIAVRYRPLAMNRRSLQRFVKGSVALIAVATLAFTLPLLLGHKKRWHFNGEALAGTVTDAWRVRFETPLPFVAGPVWLAGNAAIYSEARPLAVIDTEAGIEKYAWDALKEKGGIVVWPADTLPDATPALPELWQERFSSAEVQRSLRLYWRNGRDHPPYRVGWAIIPPQPPQSPPDVPVAPPPPSPVTPLPPPPASGAAE